MIVEIIPKKLKGIIDVIPSKSCLHRAIICASLAEGVSVIDNIIFSDDIKATIEACIKLGCEIKISKDSLVIRGVAKFNENQIIDCNESGSTLRFMIPIFMINSKKSKFIGKESLFKRPLNIYYDIFKEQNIDYKINSFLEINGQLKSGVFNVDGSVSSQFITGLLFSLPLLNGDSKIVIINDLESKGYVDITIDILRKFGIKIINNDYKEFIVKGNQKYISTNYTTEADYSSASFYLVANELGNDIKLSKLKEDSLQPDRKIITDIVDIKNNIDVDLSSNPDCGPILSVLASFHDVNFINSKRLKLKESDRIESMVINLNKLGATLTGTNDSINFVKVNKLNGNVELDCFNDHRVCMALAIASTMCDSEITLLGAECVEKSYPNFWEDFKKLGGEFYVK